eukprot:SAG31_NODE_11181_length_1057_cov_25.751566_1_plen_239_part_00
MDLAVAPLVAGNLELVGADGSITQVSDLGPFRIGRGQCGLPCSPKIHRVHVELVLAPLSGMWGAHRPRAASNPAYLQRMNLPEKVLLPPDGCPVPLFDGDRIFFSFIKNGFSVLARRSSSALPELGELSDDRETQPNDEADESGQQQVEWPVDNRHVRLREPLPQQQSPCSSAGAAAAARHVDSRYYPDTGRASAVADGPIARIASPDKGTGGFRDAIRVGQMFGKLTKSIATLARPG